MKLTKLIPLTSLQIVQVLDAARLGKTAVRIQHGTVLDKLRKQMPQLQPVYEVITGTSITRPVYHLSLEDTTTFLLSYAYMVETVNVLRSQDVVPAAPSAPVVLAVQEGADGVKTMSSLDMVAYINSTREPGSAEVRHDDFMRKVPTVIENAPKFFGTQIYNNNNTRTICHFPRREAMLMAMSYSYKLQATVFDAWEAAEAKLAAQAPTVVGIPTNYLDALKQLVATVETTEKQALQITQQAVQIEEAAPAVAFVEKYVQADGDFTFRQVAEHLRAPEKAFRNFLVDRGIQYKINKIYMHAKAHGAAGRFRMVNGVTPPSEKYPEGVAWQRSYFTAKGVEWVSNLWNTRDTYVAKLRKPLSEPKSVANYY